MDKDVKNEPTCNSETIVKEEVDLDINISEGNSHNNTNNDLSQTSGSTSLRKPAQKSENSFISTSFTIPNCHSWNCKYKCHEVDKEIKRKIFQSFWIDLNYAEKMQFVSDNISLTTNKKGVLREYHFTIDGKLRKFCFRTFTKTLGITNDWIEKALKRFDRKPDDSSSLETPKIKEEPEIIVIKDEENDESISNSDFKEDDFENKLQKEILQKQSSALRSSCSQESDNYNFKTIFLASNMEFLPEDAETSEEDTPEVIEEKREFPKTSRIKSNCAEKGLKDLKSKDSDTVSTVMYEINLQRSKKSCGNCSACCIPESVKRTMKIDFWKIQRYPNRIKFLAQNIKIVRVKDAETGDNKFTHKFFLNFNGKQEHVCQAGFQSVLSINSQYLFTGIKLAYERNNSDRFASYLDEYKLSYKKEMKANSGEESEPKQTVTSQKENMNADVKCNCSLKCFMTKDQSIEIFNEFWNLNNLSKKCEYILEHININLNEPGQRSHPKLFLRVNGYLKRVCEPFFLKILCIEERLIEAAIEKKLRMFFKESNDQEINISNYADVNIKIKDNIPSNETILPFGKSVKVPCDDCYQFCCRRITEERRRKIFREFWNLTDFSKMYEFISSMIDVSDDNGQTYQYFLKFNGKRQRVCQIMFQTTLDINKLWVDISLKKNGRLPPKSKKSNSKCKRPLSPGAVIKNAKKFSSDVKTETKFKTEPEDGIEIIDLSSDSSEDEDSNVPENAKKAKFQNLEDPSSVVKNEDLALLLEIQKPEPEINETPVSSASTLRKKEDFALKIEESDSEMDENPVLDKMKKQFCSVNCKLDCHLLHDRMEDISEEFWELPTRLEKFKFIFNHVGKFPFKVKDLSMKEFKSLKLVYFFVIDEKPRKVCRQMFITTLDINIQWIYTPLKYFAIKIADIARNEKQNRSGQNPSFPLVDNDSIMAFEVGLSYLTNKGTSHPEREMQEMCFNCCFHCETIRERDREKIFHDFWNLPNRSEKYKYISKHVSKDLEEYDFHINGKLRKVCQKMFISTLNIDPIWIYKLNDLKNSV